MRKPVLLWPLLAGLGLLAGLAGCSSARPPERAARAPAAAASAGPVATTALFDFYESPWLGLHHFLYQWAVAEETPARRAFRVVPVPETAELAQLAPEEREAWQQALDHYRQTWIGRDLLFDQDLVAIKQKLSALPASPDVFLTGLPTDLATALSKAMPVYRRHWWVRHQAADAAWIEGLVPRLRKLEIPLLRRTTRR